VGGCGLHFTQLLHCAACAAARSLPHTNPSLCCGWCRLLAPVSNSPAFLHIPQVTTAVLKGGERFDCSLVLVGTGARPNTALLKVGFAFLTLSCRPACFSSRPQQDCALFSCT
jgi:hypothetical protein